MFNKMIRRNKGKLNNSGSTMLIVMVAIALIAVLATVLMSMSYMNYNMKVTEYQSKKNFYSAEVVLDQINVGLQKEMSDSLEDAYIRSMQRYTLDDDDTRNANFANYYISELTKRLRKAALDSQYQIAPIDTDGDGVYDCGLVHYLDSSLQAAYLNGDLIIDSKEMTEPLMQSVAISKSDASGNITYESQGLILYNLYISYTDANDYTTVIETDIRLKTPSLTLVTKTAMPNVFDYSLVADAGIVGGSTAVNATFDGNVYAGNDTGVLTDLGGIACYPSSTSWTFTGESTIISAGPMQVKNGATLTADDETNCWVESIHLPKNGNLTSGNLTLKGQTYVKDDLTIEGTGAKVTLAGDYYGFGYGSTAEKSSAIILNGRNAQVDMTGLNRLMLGGNAYIQTSQVSYTVNASQGYIADNNTDVLTGNALAVKSDQIAYLVPAECIGVSGNQVKIGKNPMSEKEYKDWKSYATTDPNYEMVSLTKEIKILGKSLNQYELNSPAYKTVFRTINGSTLCYLYLDLTQDGATDYYKDYYYAAETRMKNYIKTYNNRILMNTSNMDEFTTRGTMLTYALDAGPVKGDISLVENTINDTLTAEEIAAIEQEYKENDERFNRLKAKLTTEQTEVTAAELANTVYENLINEAVMNALPANNTGKSYEFEFTSAGLKTEAVFVNNKGKGAYVYGDQAEEEDICVIVATGDVYLKNSFDGLLITDGKVYIDGATSIVPNKSLVLKTLGQMESSDADAMSLIAKYFKNGDKYSLDTQLSGEVTNSMAGTSMGELIIYENWTKQ